MLSHLRIILSRISKPTFIYLLLFLFLHLTLFNVNVAEWGDSYRILRSSEYIRNGAYPDDEKRPPLLSALIATRPSFLDPIVYSRALVFAFSLGSLILVISLLRKNLTSEKYVAFSVVLFLLNNAYLYWSLRIMADVPFGFFALLALYFVDSQPSGRRSLILKNLGLGLIVALSVLMRFEGYLLLASIIAGLVISKLASPGKMLAAAIKKLTGLIPFILGFALFEIPYLLWKNPLNSSYFEEPSGRAYDLVMLASYVVSLVYLWGFIPAIPLLITQFKKGKTYFVDHPAVFVFVSLELLLIVLWPAALPRLFVSIVPFLCLVVALALESYFELNSPNRVWVGLLSLALLFVYPVAQHFLKLQFLIIEKPLIIANVLIQLTIIIFLYYRHFYKLILTSAVGLAFWSIVIIFSHRYIYISIKNAAEYTAGNLTGNIAYNDVSSVSSWYLNFEKKAPIHSFYYDIGKKDALTAPTLAKEQVDYLLITNEHNPDMVIDLKKRPYLEEIRDFRYNVNGQEFFTLVVKFNQAQKK
jgi:hypothetical protein